MRKYLAILVSLILLTLSVFSQSAQHQINLGVTKSSSSGPTTPPTFEADAINTTSASTTLDINFTFPTGLSNRALILITTCDSGTATVSGATWHTSENLTFVGRQVQSAGGQTVEIWKLTNPTDDFNTCSVTFSTSVNAWGVLGAFSGVDQTTSTENFNSASAVDGSPTVSVTSNTGSLVVGAVIWATNPPFTATLGAGQTQFGGEVIAGLNLNMRPSYETGSTSTTFSYSFASNAWGIAACSLRGL